MVRQRLLSFLSRFDTLSDSQHGFRAGLSTETACINYVNFLYDRLDAGDHVVGLFFDLSRAFDTLLQLV